MTTGIVERNMVPAGVVAHPAAWSDPSRPHMIAQNHARRRAHVITRALQRGCRRTPGPGGSVARGAAGRRARSCEPAGGCSTR